MLLTWGLLESRNQARIQDTRNQGAQPAYNSQKRTIVLFWAKNPGATADIASSPATPGLKPILTISRFCPMHWAKV
jgi:hypothetical protein